MITSKTISGAMYPNEFYVHFSDREGGTISYSSWQGGDDLSVKDFLVFAYMIGEMKEWLYADQAAKGNLMEKEQ